MNKQMQVKWHNTIKDDFDQLLLAGDIGGTNSTYGILGFKNNIFTLLLTSTFSSQDVSGVLDPLQQTIETAAAEIDTSKISKLCISAAGPNDGRKCQLTNTKWSIDADEIEISTGIKTVLINDFQAISYSLPLLDISDPEQILQIKHSINHCPAPSGNVRAVVGAGTGLGVGYSLHSPSGYIAGASEAGHCTFQPFDDESNKLHDFLFKRFGKSPDAESYISGQGINNIFDYYCYANGSNLSNIALDILKSDRDDRPAAISHNVSNDEICAMVMKLFVMMYGKFCGEIAVAFLPTAGLYLGGGIVTKNIKLFIENDWFISSFENTFCNNLKETLKNIPVYIIRNYSVSLYGAAHAAVILI